MQLTRNIHWRGNCPFCGHSMEGWHAVVFVSRRGSINVKCDHCRRVSLLIVSRNWLGGLRSTLHVR